MSANEMGNPFDVLLREIRDLKGLMLSGDRSQGNKVEADVQYMRCSAAAEFLSISEGALRIIAHNSRIPYIKKQNKLWFRKSDLIDWMEMGSVERQSDEPFTAIARVKCKGGASHG